MTDPRALVVLGTVPATTRWRKRAGRGLVDVVAGFEDWTFDGIALRELVAARWGVDEPPFERTWLTREFPEGAVVALRALLGMRPGDFDDGRVSLLICPIDEDLECRALSTRLVIGPDVVEWRAVGWQVLREPFEPLPDEYGPLLSFRFDRTRYEMLLRTLMSEYVALVASLPGAPPVEPPRGGWFRRRRGN